MKLRLLNDEALREVCVPVKEGEMGYFPEVIPEMEAIMNEAGGVALAANQVGINKRFFIKKIEGAEGIEVLINPEIIEKSVPEDFEEGCLSIPGTSATIKRSLTVKVKYRDTSFAEQEQTYTGTMAVAIQHEIDHLDGKLYIDYLGEMKRKLVVDKHKKFMKVKSRR